MYWRRLLIQTRGTLDREIQLIEENILKMGSMLAHAIRRSIVALENRDVELARKVIADDLLNAIQWE